jgi:hypothetical protein
MEPGEVVLTTVCKRRRSIDMCRSGTCTVSGDVTLELFQTTKSADPLHFRARCTNDSWVEVKAQAMIGARPRCRGDRARQGRWRLHRQHTGGIAKASLMIEEQQGSKSVDWQAGESGRFPVSLALPYSKSSRNIPKLSILLSQHAELNPRPTD